MAVHSLIGEISGALADRDLARLRRLLHDDVKFFGMLSDEPAVGAETVIRVFAMLVEVCDDVHYVEEFTNNGGAVLLSRGRVRGQPYEAIQLLRQNADGLVTEFHDSLRPVAALQALQSAVGDYLQSRKRAG